MNIWARPEPTLDEGAAGGSVVRAREPRSQDGRLTGDCSGV